MLPLVFFDCAPFVPDRREYIFKKSKL